MHDKHEETENEFRQKREIVSQNDTEKLLLNMIQINHKWLTLKLAFCFQ